MKIKKYIAPIIIGIMMVVYFSTVGIFVILLDTGILVKLFVAGVPLCLALLAIYVMVQRINEIKDGEEDDARKY